MSRVETILEVLQVQILDLLILLQQQIINSTLVSQEPLPPVPKPLAPLLVVSLWCMTFPLAPILFMSRVETFRVVPLELVISLLIH